MRPSLLLTSTPSHSMMSASAGARLALGRRLERRAVAPVAGSTDSRPCAGSGSGSGSGEMEQMRLAGGLHVRATACGWVGRGHLSSCLPAGSVHLGGVADDEVAIWVHHHAQRLPPQPCNMLQPARQGWQLSLIARSSRCAVQQAAGRLPRQQRQRRACLAGAPRSAAAGRWWRMPGRRSHQGAPRAFLHRPASYSIHQWLGGAAGRAHTTWWHAGQAAAPPHTTPPSQSHSPGLTTPLNSC